MKKFFVLTLVVLASVAQAESTAAKKELVAKVLLLQQPGIEMAARALAERPAVLMLQQAGQAMQARVAPEKREAMAKEIQADVKKYVEETVPLVQGPSAKVAAQTIGAVLEEKFTEEELKQLIAIIESPVNRKFLELNAEMQTAFADKLVEQTRAVVEPKMRALDQAIGKRLGLPVPAGTSLAPAKQPAKQPAKAASN